MSINIGPHHPSTHGVFRMIATVEGEIIQKVEPVLGYLHRGFEKLGEYKLYKSGLPLTDRMDYLASIFNNHVYSLAVETLCGIEVPLRAKYIRVLVCELDRIASHLIGIGAFLQDLGNLTPFVYMFRDREEVYELFEEICGARQLYSYIRPGGVLLDLTDGFETRVEKFLKKMDNFLKEYDDLLDKNEIFRLRTKHIGYISGQKALNFSLSGPNLRASGIAKDLRKDSPYEIYNKLDFEICVEQTGDVWARYKVRMNEIKESVKIIRQILGNIPNGNYLAQTHQILTPNPGEVYTCIESPRGQLGIYMVSDGSEKPYRYKVRSPSFMAIGALNEMVKNEKIADAIAILGSIDIVLGEVDR